LLPVWDSKWLPRYLAKAMDRNWAYFKRSFSGLALAHTGWTRYKRQAEVANSNAFDSFNRALQEPGSTRRKTAQYYELIIHSLQITRELNNLHLEEEEGRGAKTTGIPADEETRILLRECTEAFGAVWENLRQLSAHKLRHEKPQMLDGNPPALNAAQKLALRKIFELLIEFQSLLKAIPEYDTAQTED
jgi:uncharacterized membrane protein YccC